MKLQRHEHSYSSRDFKSTKRYYLLVDGKLIINIKEYLNHISIRRR